MIDKDILPNLGYSDVAEMLHENQELMDKLQKNPELNLVSGISFEESSANIYNEQAQLMRRMADIYDEWAEQLRSRN